MEIKTTREELVELAEQLPARYHEDAIRFLKLLLNQKPPGRKHLRLDWAGALKDLRDEYTSLELQKEALDLMEESAMKNVSR